MNDNSTNVPPSLSGSPSLYTERESEGEVVPQDNPIDAPPPPPRGSVRPSGGQLGNQNARKHGLYSKYLAPKQRQDYDAACGVRGVEAELALFRCKLAEMLETEPWNWALLNRIVNTIMRLEAALPPEPQESGIQGKFLNIMSQSFAHSLAVGEERTTRAFHDWMAKNHGGGLVSENESHVQPKADSARFVPDKRF